MHHGMKVVSFMYYAALAEFIAKWAEAEKDQSPPGSSGLDPSSSHKVLDTGA